MSQKKYEETDELTSSHPFPTGLVHLEGSRVEREAQQHPYQSLFLPPIVLVYLLTDLSNSTKHLRNVWDLSQIEVAQYQ